MTVEEAADAMLVYAPGWPDKITPIGSGETLTGEPMPDVAAAVRRSRRSR